jgi:hypothetical protein
MADIHELIARDGIAEAKRQAISKHEMAVVETAQKMLADDADQMGFTYSGFALTSLPHKPQKELVWRKEGHNLTLLMQSGLDSNGEPVGLPYGSYARYILLFLQSEAIKTGSREVELGRCMKIWLGNMGLSIGGTTYRIAQEQAKRISGCHLQFFKQMDGGTEAMRHGGFVDGSITLSNVSVDQPALWQDKVLLNEEFYRALREHPVPVSEAALRAIGPRSMVMDVYIWLAYRLHALTRDVPVSWPALHAQFGGGFQLIRKFRSHFAECLALALAAYPDARVSIDDDGVVLRPSRPAVGKARGGTRLHFPG